jgi:hypothetical protein
MSKHRNPQKRLPKQARPDNFDSGLAIERLYRELVEVEALAIAADEAVTMLPPTPRGKDKRTLARLYTLVTKTADQASQALEKSEDMLAQLAAHAAARAAKQPRKRRAA